MFGKCSLTPTFLLLCSLSARAADADVLWPPETTLNRAGATQRLVLAGMAGGQVTSDRTAQASFSSSNPDVATVDAAGIVTAVHDGVSTISALRQGQSTTAQVRVAGAGTPFTPSFRNQIIPLMTSVGCNSGSCHGALAGKGGMKLSLRGYDPETDHFVLTRQTLGRRVDPIEPELSLLLRKPTMTVTHGGGQKLDVGSSDYQLLADWIASGAPGPKADDPRIVRVEVFPTVAVLKPKDELNLVVRAWYSNGQSQDVTAWSRFNSTEDLTASVSADGKVKVAGTGEAAITVWYSNQVAAARIAVPQVGADAGIFKKAERTNFIDTLVVDKLQSLGIPPSQLCTDGEFIRRVYLDAAGILPNPKEVHEFLADKRADKRARLIDALMQRPEFVDYWTYRWSDLLLLSTAKLSQPAMWSFHEFIRDSVAANKPWDRFARELLTARGSTLENGAANYFVLHKDVTELTEATSVTFLGMSITCCRCHNHPLEKWTQDQYWSMSNLFSRVALKNGDRGGEIIVQAQPSGDALHPRRGIAMPPTPLDGKPLSLESTIDRRAYFADWLTKADNPYFAKALINRVWRNFMGRGLVEPEDDLRQTNPPTNSELFNALAKNFVEHGYDVQHLMRDIMNSAAYQRSATPLAGNVKDERFYSHYLVRRLPAEVILDAYSQVTEVPTSFSIFFDARPIFAFTKGMRALQLPDVKVASAFLDAFGRPERSQTCSCERQQDATVGQALHVNNGATLNDKLRAKEGRLERWTREKIGDAEVVREVFELALCREPDRDEAAKFIALLKQVPADGGGARREALEDLMWAVLTSREFLFNR
jgi:Protein of unknown function (DUF1553)/Protein of unknown function (DUF1549)/Bacterial Ig-like domain (group 2)